MASVMEKEYPQSWHREKDAASYIQAIRDKKITIRRNKWREDPKFNVENHKLLGYLGAGAFGTVLEVSNTETNKYYALKLQPGLKPFNLSGSHPEGFLEPPLTPSSEATKSSLHSVERLSLRAKRHQEARVYLRFIRSGHPNICNLEAFVQYTPGYGDDEFALGLYFEYCDSGSLASLSKGFRTRSTKPPELFIWHFFYEIISGIAFLHNEHPDYNTKPEHKGRGPIIHNDMSSANVFLQWGTDKEGGYPHVKLGDFGCSVVEPAGGYVPDPEYDAPPPDDPNLRPQAFRLKEEIWCVGALVYELANTGLVLNHDFLEYNLRQQRRKFRKLDPVDIHLSESLHKVIWKTLTPEIEKRPSSGELYPRLKSAFEKRAGVMYRKLPDWAYEVSLKGRFDEKRIKELIKGGLEIEVAAYNKLRAIMARNTELWDQYFIDHEDEEDEEETEPDEVLNARFLELATQQIEEEAKRKVQDAEISSE